MTALRSTPVVSWTIFISISLAAAAWAQQPVPGATGNATFSMYCSSCHGTSAKGDGPLAASLSKRPADLTLIATRNNNVFPSEEVARIIDGRRPVKGHGGGDMPVWGTAFSKSSDALPVEERVRRVVAYLGSIQVKP
jgi:mono/diheme cytochrome c family protein